MSQQDIKTAKFEMRKLADLKNWENNPRSILEEDFKRLKGQISKLGLYKTLLVNQDNIVLGGNMRLRAFKDLGFTEIMCGVVETTDEGQMLEYALSDNDQAGTTDDLKLAEVFHLHPIETSLFKIQSNVLRPLESIINPADPATLGGEPGTDNSSMDESLDQYLNGNIKQIVLYYDNEQYATVIDQLQAIGREMGIEDNTSIITKLIGERHEGIAADQATA
jgi:hypothetical protein